MVLGLWEHRYALKRDEKFDISHGIESAMSQVVIEHVLPHMKCHQNFTQIETRTCCASQHSFVLGPAVVNIISRFRRTAFHNSIKSIVGLIVAKAAALRENLDVHGSSSHTSIRCNTLDKLEFGVGRTFEEKVKDLHLQSQLKAQSASGSQI
jgi:hypothetical protein